MVRVAELTRRARRQRGRWTNDPQSPGRVLSQVRDHVLRQKASQAAILRDIFGVLAREGLLIYSDFGDEHDIDPEMKEAVSDLKFIVRRNSEPLPPLLSERLHVFVRFPDEYAIITIEDRQQRLVHLSKRGRTHRFALLERWLAARAATFFPGREIIEAFPFKIIRDADLRYHPDDEESLQEQIVEAVGRRLKARVIRLEVDAQNYSEGALFLATHLGLDSAALYRFEKGELVKIDTLEKLSELLEVSVPTLLGVGMEYVPSAVAYFERLRQIEESAEQIIVLAGPISYLLASPSFDDTLAQVLTESIPDDLPGCERASTEVAGAVVEEVKTLVAGSQSVLQLKLADSVKGARTENRFAAVDQGFIRDSQTGLVWTQSDNGSDIIWQGARQYCASKGLELPSVDELRAIYDASLPGVSCGDYKCKVSKLFQLTNSWFWSATPGSGSGEAWGVYLVSGGRSSGVVSIGNGRALCVRRS